LLERLESFRRRIARIDLKLELLAAQFPQTSALLDIRGIGLYSALVIIAEFGEVDRFRSGKQAAHMPAWERVSDSLEAPVDTNESLVTARRGCAGFSSRQKSR
jgi:hypothetical protein